MALDDILRDQDELQKHEYRMWLWPRQWRAYQNRVPCQWQKCRLVRANQRNIPEGPGVYTLVIVTEVAGHPHGHYLMYVGETKSLRRRFGEYLGKEKRQSGRPKVFRLLNRYDQYMWFCYTEASLADRIMLEDDLTEAFMPPCNDEFPASVSKVRGAF